MERPREPFVSLSDRPEAAAQGVWPSAVNSPAPAATPTATSRAAQPMPTPRVAPSASWALCSPPSPSAEAGDPALAELSSHQGLTRWLGGTGALRLRVCAGVRWCRAV
jgi:hypothetical protein